MPFTKTKILMAIHGMGEAEKGFSDEWAKILFPGASITSNKNEKFLTDDQGENIYIFEVFYEDINDKLFEKFEGLQNVYDTIPVNKTKDFLKEYVHDVILNVLVPDAIHAAQIRFIETYRRILKLAAKKSGNVALARVGVLCHSLGTLFGYEGIYKTFDTPEFTQFTRMNLVMCAPMLAPICNVQHMLGLKRYLTENQSNKPYKPNPATGSLYTILNKCTAYYNTKDPFHLIHSDDFYDRQKVGNDLVDQLITFSEGDKGFKSHAITSYLKARRQHILNALWE